MQIDEMLAKAGDFGRYQIFLMMLFSIVNILSAFHYFSQTFISVVPEHWCNTTELWNIKPNDSNIELIRHYLSPLADKSCSRMERVYDGDYREREENSVDDWVAKECDTGWIYYRDNDFDSIVSELDWVCKDSWKPMVGQSTFFAGSVLGTMFFGILSDRIGRLPVLSLANLIALVGNVATVFVSDLTNFALCRFLSGLATDSNFFMMYIIVMEYVRPSMRTFGLNLCIGVFYCLGCVLVPLAAVALGQWRRFLLLTSLPISIVTGYYFVVPESALWLISKGRVSEAIQCFVRISKINRKVISDEDIRRFEESASSYSEGTASGSLIGLFKTPRLRRKTCILIFKSMVLTLCYDAISRNVNGLGFSPFIMFSMTSISILPSCILILVFQDKIGRKAMASSSLLLTGIFTAVAGILLAMDEDTDPYVTASLAVVGRLGVNIAYNSGAQYAAELIPTVVRGQGVGTIHVAGYGATFFSSYILYLSNYWLALPSLILGGLSVICAGLCLLLPETLGRALPTTLEEGEIFGEGEGIWEFACCSNKAVSTLELIDPEKR